MPGRGYSATGAYRYGFNGKENDNEVKGAMNQIAFEKRVYDPRICRFLSRDPLEGSFTWQTPYVFAGGNPIKFLDVLGMGPGDPVPIYHRTSSERAAEIGNDGFNPKLSKRNGFTYFTTTEKTGGIGTSAAQANTIINATIDLSNAKEISARQMADWYNEGFTTANKEFGTNYSSMTDVPEALRSKYQSIADGVRNSKLADFMKADGGSVYRISTKSTIAVAEHAIGQVKIVGLSGPGASKAISLMSRPALNGESAAALRQYEKATSTIKWGGRACLAVAVAADLYEIYQSDNIIRTVTKKVGGWMGATVGATAGATYGGTGGSIVPGAGNLVGAVGGAIIGGIVGFIVGESATETLYDFLFTRGVSAK